MNVSGPLERSGNNSLLAALPKEEYEPLLHHMQLVDLSFGEILHESGDSIRYVFFPHDAVISLVSQMKSGASASSSLSLSRAPHRRSAVRRSCSRPMRMAPAGPMSRSPRPSTAVSRRLRISANVWSRKDSMRPSTTGRSRRARTRSKSGAIWSRG